MIAAPDGSIVALTGRGLQGQRIHIHLLVAATAVLVRLPLVTRSGHDFHVDNRLGGCRYRTCDARSHAMSELPNWRINPNVMLSV